MTVFPEDEAKRIIEPLENEFLQHLKDEGIFDIVIKNPFSLGGIQNTLGHPEKALAKQYTMSLIDLCRTVGISDNVIRQVVKYSLEERQGKINAGFDLEPLTEEQLYGE